MACSRVTEGKSARKTSKPSPASRWSSRLRAGTRVPAKQGVPLMISGSMTTMSLLFMPAAYSGAPRRHPPVFPTPRLRWATGLGISGSVTGSSRQGPAPAGARRAGCLTQ